MFDMLSCTGLENERIRGVKAPVVGLCDKRNIDAMIYRFHVCIQRVIFFGVNNVLASRLPEIIC